MSLTHSHAQVLEQFGTPAQKAQWLDPLLEGRIRSCFAMTEPGVASSDASQISCRIDKSADGKRYVRMCVGCAV